MLPELSGILPEIKSLACRWTTAHHDDWLNMWPFSKADPLCYRKLVNKLDAQRLTDIVVEAVDIEKEFICEALSVDLIGMNKSLMSQYIDFCADRLLVALGQQKHYNTPNPFEWMEQLSLQ